MIFIITAKYFFIVASSNNKQPACSEVEEYINYVLERVDWTRDLHFQTKINSNLTKILTKTNIVL